MIALGTMLPTLAFRDTCGLLQLPMKLLNLPAEATFGARRLGVGLR